MSEKERVKVLINLLTKHCGYFSSESSVGNYYNCTHPAQEEMECDDDTGQMVGKCLRCSCPIASEDEDEDETMFLFDETIIARMRERGAI